MGPFIPRKRRPGLPDREFRVGDRVRVRAGHHLTFSGRVMDAQLQGDIYAHEGTVVRANAATPLINWDGGAMLVYDAACLELIAEEPF